MTSWSSSRAASTTQHEGRPRRVAARLAEQPELFDRIFYKVDLRHLRNRALLLAPLEQIKTIQRDYLDDMQPLLDFGPLSWHGLGLTSIVHGSPHAHRRTQARSAAVGLPTSASSANWSVSAARRTGALRDPSALRQPLGQPDSARTDQQENLLAEPQYFFSGDGEAGVSARPAGQGRRLVHRRA